MKSCNEMAESVFTRINEYETAKRRKKKIILSTAVPASFLCAAVIAGIAIHIAGAGERLRLSKAARRKTAEAQSPPRRYHPIRNAKNLHILTTICSAWFILTESNMCRALPIS